MPVWQCDDCGFRWFARTVRRQCKNCGKSGTMKTIVLLNMDREMKINNVGEQLIDLD